MFYKSYLFISSEISAANDEVEAVNIFCKKIANYSMSGCKALSGICL